MDERAFALNPFGPDNAKSWTLILMHRYDEAMQAAQEEAAPDRFPVSGRENIGLIQFATGQQETAIATLEQVVRDFPEETSSLTNLGWVYGRAGQTDRAREVLRRLMVMSESRHVSPLALASVAAGFNDRDLAFAQLEGAFARRDPMLPSLGIDYFYDPIRDDPRFREMLQRLKLDGFFPETTKS